MLSAAFRSCAACDSRLSSRVDFDFGVSETRRVSLKRVAM